MTEYTNSEIAYVISYYCTEILNEEYPYQYSYPPVSPSNPGGDIFNEEYFGNITWHDPLKTVTWAIIETYLEEALIHWDFHYTNLTTAQLKTRFIALEEGKVDKEDGKGLSEENFTEALKTKLSGIASGATANDSDSNLKNRANHTGSQAASTISDFADAVDGRITAQKGEFDGLAPLDNGGKVPAAFLPSYVDDVLEFANLAGFPVTGESGKIYTALDNNKIYRWSGSTYVEISASPGSTDAVTEGATNKYFTEDRVRTTALTGLSTATNSTALATDTVLQAIGKLQAQVNALVTWKAKIKIDKLEAFATTTDANGDFTINTSVAFTHPRAFPAVNATAGAEGFHVHINSVSGTTVTGRAFKNKTQGVLLGGTIDPDNPVASGTTIRIIVVDAL